MPIAYRNTAASMLPRHRNLPPVYYYQNAEGCRLRTPAIVERWQHSLRKQRASLLTFLGIGHSTSSTSDQYLAVCNEFALWQHETRGEPRTFLCEGRVREPKETAEASVSSDGRESALFSFWARQYDIPIESWERPFPDQVAALKPSTKQKRESILYYLAGREQPQIVGSTDPGPLQSEHVRTGLAATIDRYSQLLPWDDFDFSFTTFAAIHERLYPGRPLDILDTAFFTQETIDGMYDPQSPVQEVSADINTIRDNDLIDTVLRHRRAGQHVFGFAGELHLDSLTRVI